MTNTFITAENLGLIGREAAYEFKNNQTFLATATHTYDHMYDKNTYYNPGDTVQVRLPNNYLTQEGDTVTVQDIKERSIPLVLEPILSLPLAYTTTDLTTAMGGGVSESWKKRVLFPAVRSLVSTLNLKVAVKAKTQTNLYTGDEAANINAYAVVDNAGAVLDEHSCSRSLRRYCALATRQSAALRQSTSLQNSFVQSINKDITLNSQLGRLADFDMFSDQSIAYQDTTADARAGVTVKTSVASGATSIVMTGFTVSTAGIVKEGDVFSFTGIKSVNPITKASTGQDFQLVATADATSDSGGDATISVYPAPIFGATEPNADINTQIIATTPVVFVADHHVNMAWSEDGLIVVCPPLTPLDTPYCTTIKDPDTGYSLRLSKSAEILQNKNIMRLDVLYGIRWLNDRAVRILSL